MRFPLSIKTTLLTKSVAVGTTAALLGAGVAVAAPGSPVSFVTVSETGDDADASQGEEDATLGDEVPEDEDGVPEDDAPEDDAPEGDDVAADVIEEVEEEAVEEEGDKNSGVGSAVSRAVHEAQAATPPGPERGKAVSAAARKANGSFKGGDTAVEEPVVDRAPVDGSTDESVAQSSTSDDGKGKGPKGNGKAPKR